MFNPSAKQQRAFAQESRPYMPAEPLDGPLEATLLFYFGRPKYHFGTGKNALKLKETAPIWHNKKTDLDNLIKFVLDS